MLKFPDNFYSSVFVFLLLVVSTIAAIAHCFKKMLDYVFTVTFTLYFALVRSMFDGKGPQSPCSDLPNAFNAEGIIISYTLQ